MNKKLINLLGILCVCPALLVAQEVEDETNMVLNPSFEQYEKCPEGYIYNDKSHRLIPHWTYPSYTTPDYFNKCSTGEVRCPTILPDTASRTAERAIWAPFLRGLTATIANISRAN